MQQQQTKKIVIFVVAMAAWVAIYFVAKFWLFPPPPPPAPVEAKLAAALLSPSDGGFAQGITQAAVVWSAEAKRSPDAKPDEKPDEAPPPVVAEKPPPAQEKLKTLGDASRTSKFHIRAVLTPRGGGVLSVLLNKFQQADALGRPVKESDGSPAPLELVPPDPTNPSCQLLNFDVNKKDDDKPYDALGKADWTGAADGNTEPEVTTDTVDGRERQSVTFWSPEVQGFKVAKTYSLTEGEYHLGLEVKVRRIAKATLDADKALPFRYQMTSFHGLPVEGRWYTNYFRNALIGQVDAKTGYVSRDLQDLRQTMSWEGGNPVERQQGYVMRYAGVAVQYFASVIVVDSNQEKQDFLAHARPTLEKAVVKGVIGNVDFVHHTFELVRSDNHKTEIFRFHEEERANLVEQGLHKDVKTAVLYTTGGYEGEKDYPEYAHQLLDDAQTQPLWEDDVTVRVATEPIELKPGGEVVHKYLLYNGPVKTMLLSQMGGVEAVRPELVNHYLYDLNLDTLTDYQSNNWFGNYITGPLRISYLLIQITNIMHTVLWGLHYYVGIPYIVCIMLLTLMVRGVMFPVSRKQAMTSLRMQELAPELKKLKEKFGDDKAAMGAAQMELYRKHGINPLGTCWMLLLQMPIFMGLYYSLQESIHFRLAGVSSYWMPNLAAPDMLVYWSNSIPFISQPEWYGWPFYLGPFLNVLPIVAVSFTLVQQKWTMPPPTDEQQEQQQKMMKYMMVFMGFIFYKMASGLCIYFIASSLWGFMERRMLPKRKPGAPPMETKAGVLSKLLPPKSANGTGVTTAKETFSSRFFKEEPRGKGKRGKRGQEKAGKAEGDGTMWDRLRAWWEDVLEQAQKK